MIEREYFKIVEKELKNDEITALVGSRQVGKTTILKYLYEKLLEKKEKVIFLSFDDISILNMFENNLSLFEEQYIQKYKIVFIDEIQYSKKSGKQLKYFYDKYKTKFFISGSSSPELSINSLQYLVGRVNIIEVFSINFEDYINYVSSDKSFLFEKLRTQQDLNQLKIDFENFLKFGAYPKVIITEDIEEKKKKIKNIINTYILKEIKEILNFKNIFEYENLLKRLALSDGGITNKSNVSAELDINRVKLDKMLYIFDKTYIIKILKPYLNNKIKELIKTPKIYFYDLGFKNSLINNFNELSLRSEKGYIYENFILNELIKNNYDVKFWNLENRFEIDFLIEKNQKIIGFEIKFKLKDSSLSKSIKKFIELNNPKEVYIFNETIDVEISYKNTKIIFTNYLNIIYILKNLIF